MNICIIDYGQPSFQKLINIITQLSNFVVISPHDPYPPNINGFILTGSPDRINQVGARKLPIWYSQITVPILGICYGYHLICQYHGSPILTFPQTHTQLELVQFTDPPNHLMIGYFNHNDYVYEIPPHFHIIATWNHGIAGICNHLEWGYQFHPELTNDGHVLIHNFIRYCHNYNVV